MNELIDVVDEENKVIAQLNRPEIRKNASIHKIVKILIIDMEGKFLFQKRCKNKDMYPCCWDIGVAETLKSGETYEEAAIRGLKEELGIGNISLTKMTHSFQFRYKFRSPLHNVNYKIFMILYYENYGKIVPQAEEVEEIRHLTKNEALQLIKQEAFHPAVPMIFEKYLESKELMKWH